MDKVNRDQRFVTTSTCSGRIAIYLEDSKTHRKNAGRLLYTNHHALYDINEMKEAIETRASGPQTLSCYGTVKKTPGLLADTVEGIVWFSVEPLIIHIEAIDLPSLSLLQSIAQKAGLKFSGILQASKRKLINIRGSQRIHAPVARVSQETGLTWLVTAEYLTLLQSLANDKLIINLRQIERLEEELDQILQPNMESITFLKDMQWFHVFNDKEAAKHAKKQFAPPRKLFNVADWYFLPAEDNMVLEGLSDIRPVMEMLKELGIDSVVDKSRIKVSVKALIAAGKTRRAEEA